ncbi:uncharacterized protein LOC142765233 isoform X2 [Rhipicephalus microplus]|uniref:uncharacterized protein LOC142765233 isoform X2 n=1 Tax=Rhipicephalus microplus TaxID=6941 RepID=UPI003F6D933E
MEECRVKCWNEDQGGEIVVAASQLSKHFCKECDKHSTSCSKCSTVILCSDICTHIQSKCRDHVIPVESWSPITSTDGQGAVMKALKENINARAEEMKERFDQVANANNAQAIRLNEVYHCLNNIKEAAVEIQRRNNTLDNLASSTEVIREILIEHAEKLHKFEGAINKANETLKSGLESMKLAVEKTEKATADFVQMQLREFASKGGTLNKLLRKKFDIATKTICTNCTETVASILQEKFGKLTDSFEISLDKILALSTMDIRRHEFLIEGCKEVKDSALSEGSHLCEREKMYISGYYLSPGVWFQKTDEYVTLHTYFQLHKGVIDDVLTWPLNKNIRLTVKHPSEKKTRQDFSKTGYNIDFYGRPQKQSTDGWFREIASFRLDELEREGYIKNDELQIVWELVSKDSDN